MRTSKAEVLDHSVTAWCSGSQIYQHNQQLKGSLCPSGISSSLPSTEKLLRAVLCTGIKVPLNPPKANQEKLKTSERKQSQYLVSLSSCCIIRLL